MITSSKCSTNLLERDSRKNYVGPARKGEIRAT